MSKHKKRPQQRATSPKQVANHAAIHQQRLLPYALQIKNEDGQVESIGMTEAEYKTFWETGRFESPDMIITASLHTGARILSHG